MRGRSNLGAELLANSRQKGESDGRRQVLYGPDLVYKSGRAHRHLYSTLRGREGSLLEAEQEGSSKVSTFPSFGREVFSRAFKGGKGTKVEETPAEGEWSRRMHSLLDDLPEWGRLAERCRGDSFNAGVTTAAVLGDLLDEVPDHHKDARDTRQRLEALQWRESQGLQVDPGELQEARTEARAAATEAMNKANSVDESKVRQALRGAIASASKEIDDIESALRGMGWGEGQGNIGPGEPADVKREAADALRDSKKLAEIFEQAGRMRIISAQVQAEKVRHGTEELADIEAGSSIPRLLPSEVGLLALPTTRLLLLKRLAEHTALQYRLSGKEPKGKGPIVVCVDDSGSMKGAPEVWAKALALTLLDLARKQERAFAFCTFSSTLGVTVSEEKASRMGPSDILGALLPFVGGGTNWTRPLMWAAGEIAKTPELEEGDIIFLTDGYCRLDEASLAQFRSAASRSGAKVHGIVIDNPRAPEASDGPLSEAVRTFSSEVHTLSGMIEPDGSPSSSTPQDSQVLRSVLAV